ncbi:hypothetical protein CRUP_031027, partial [Coryphaenoides rupestris]
MEARAPKFTACTELGRALLTRKHKDSAAEPYVASRDLGHSVNEVEKLLKRHEAFEKSTASWEERFSALERLTTLELLELRQQQQKMEAFSTEQLERDTRPEDTGFVDDSSQLFTTEKQSL